jgi:hypothetical protein
METVKKTSEDTTLECIFIKEFDFKETSAEYRTCYVKNTFKRPKNNKANECKLKKFYNNKYLYRLSLKCSLECNNKLKKSVFVILMNPSYADYQGLDDTLFNVKNFLEKYTDKNYTDFEVLNIFPIRMSKSELLDDLLKKYKSKDICKRNTEYIINSLKTNKNDVILAWGSDYHKRKEAQAILKFLKEENVGREIYSYRINTSNGRKNTPTHFTSRIYNKIKEKQLIPLKIIEKNDLLFIEKNDEK